MRHASVALVLLWPALSACGPGRTAGDAVDADRGDVDDDASDGWYPWYEGSFDVEVAASWVQLGVPFTIHVTARDRSGAVIPGYDGRVRLAAGRATPPAPLEPFDFGIIPYRADGVRLYDGEPGVGGFAGGELTFGALAPVWGSLIPEMEVTFTVVDELNPAMIGTGSLHVLNVGVAGGESFTFVSMDESVQAGVPFHTVVRALDAAGRPDGLRRQVLLSTAEGNPVDPPEIADWSAAADAEGGIDLTVSIAEPGLQRLVLAWRTVDGRWMAQVSPPRRFAGPPLMDFTWEQVPSVPTDATVSDLWAPGDGRLYLGLNVYDDGRILLSTDDGETFALLEDVPGRVTGVGENFLDPDGVCIVVDERTDLCRDADSTAFADGVGLAFPRPGHLQAATGHCTYTPDLYRCLQGRPNKWQQCCVDGGAGLVGTAWFQSPYAGGAQFDVLQYYGGSRAPDWCTVFGDDAYFPFGFDCPLAVAWDTDRGQIFLAGVGNPSAPATILYGPFDGSWFGTAEAGIPDGLDVSSMQYDTHAKVVWAGSFDRGLWAMRRGAP